MPITRQWNLLEPNYICNIWANSIRKKAFKIKDCVTKCINLPFLKICEKEQKLTQYLLNQ